jgi:N-glycosylase/DNA lyase
MSKTSSDIEGALECPEFDLRKTLESGQTFHWVAQGDGFVGCIGSTPLFVMQKGNLLHYRGSDPKLPYLLHHYFAFDHDLKVIRESCAHHIISHQASLACRGLRIMRQPHWECLASFILSPMKQVTHIRQMSLALRHTFGDKLPGFPIPAFPSAAVLASASEAELRSCGLGFRAGNLLRTARLVHEEKFDLEALQSLRTEEARMALCSLPGIGRKVANCILLFGYERLEAVPVDVWIGRILTSFSSRKTLPSNPKKLEHYGEKLLGPYAGYIQQYLFHQARTGRLRLPKVATRMPKSPTPTTPPVSVASLRKLGVA